MSHGFALMNTDHLPSTKAGCAPFRVTLDGCSEAALESWAVEWLRDRGWWIDRPGEWETPRETCERLHISSAHLSQTLRHPMAPKPADTVKGPTGRINYLRSTPALDAFLTRHLTAQHGCRSNHELVKADGWRACPNCKKDLYPELQ